MDSLYYMGRTIGYFIVWGYGFGGIVGSLILWMIRPANTFSRETLPTEISLASGLAVGVIMAVVQAFTFHRDTDLVFYRRVASLGIGLLVSITVTFGVGSILTQVQGLDYLVILGFTFLLTGLTAGFLTHHYVMWRATLSLPGKEINEGTKPESPLGQILLEALNLLISWLPLWLYGFVLVAIVIDASQPVPPNTDSYWGNLNLSLGGLGIILGFIVALLMASIALAAYIGCITALLKFLKTLIFNEYHPFSPHSTRLILTLISLLWSLVLCQLVSFVTPLFMIIPFITTYYVYHSIALPDNGTNKAKHKEKIDPQPVGDQHA